ncbi:hypothetical protein IMZ48_18160 [Candidatus Bathyarchaeota archaeon]|nr:hypothetical protein [Candidatus Bathyarchaeota archaeon]
MVDSDLEDESSDLFLAVKPRVPATATMPPKKARGRPPGTANKVTKPAQKTTSGRSSGRLADAVADEIQETPEALEKNNQPKGRGRRKAAKDATPEEEEKPKPTRGRPRATKAAAKPAAIEHEDEDTLSYDTPPQPPAPKPRGRPGRKPAAVKTEIPETQMPEEMDLDDEEHDELEELPSRPSSGSSNAPARGAAPSSVKNQRDVDVDMSDLSLRRRLGDLTKKHEALEAKYRQLQEVGTREAERNFDRFKKQADERAQSESALRQP